MNVRGFKLKSYEITTAEDGVCDLLSVECDELVETYVFTKTDTYDTLMVVKPFQSEGSLPEETRKVLNEIHKLADPLIVTSTVFLPGNGENLRVVIEIKDSSEYLVYAKFVIRRNRIMLKTLRISSRSHRQVFKKLLKVLSGYLPEGELKPFERLVGVALSLPREF